MSCYVTKFITELCHSNFDYKTKLSNIMIRQLYTAAMFLLFKSGYSFIILTDDPSIFKSKGRIKH